MGTGQASESSITDARTEIETRHTKTKDIRSRINNDD